MTKQTTTQGSIYFIGKSPQIDAFIKELDHQGTFTLARAGKPWLSIRPYYRRRESEKRVKIFYDIIKVYDEEVQEERNITLFGDEEDHLFNYEDFEEVGEPENVKSKTEIQLEELRGAFDALCANILRVINPILESIVKWLNKLIK